MAHKRYRRQTDDRQMDGRQQIANENVSSRSLKTTSVCDGDARLSVVGVAGWPVILTVWLVTVGAVSQPAADAERQRCACAGRGDGYQCGLDWERSSSISRTRLHLVNHDVMMKNDQPDCGKPNQTQTTSTAVSHTPAHAARPWTRG